MKIITKQVPIKCIETDYGIFELSDFKEILYELEGTGYGCGLVLDSSKLEKMLLDLDIICKTTRGHVYCNNEENRLNLIKQIEEIEEIEEIEDPKENAEVNQDYY